MEAFKTHTGIIAILNRGNIDTDQIISKEHLKSIKRTGFGTTLFSDWRYLDNGEPNPDFELNQDRFNDASILVAGNNFGCGSSREHAVWAIVQYGLKVVIAPRKETDQGIIPGFADIFYNNSSKNGLLLIEVSQSEADLIMSEAEKKFGLKASIDLENQKIILDNQTKTTIEFQIDPAIKNRLIKGLDDIGNTEEYLNKIDKFEETHQTFIN